MSTDQLITLQRKLKKDVRCQEKNYINFERIASDSGSYKAKGLKNDLANAMNHLVTVSKLIPLYTYEDIHI
jgi:hypothetical protein